MTHMGFSPFVEMVWLQSSCFFGEDERPLFRRERRFFYLKAKSRENGKPINISLCAIFLIQSLSFWQRHWGKNQQRRGWRRMPFIHPCVCICFLCVCFVCAFFGMIFVMMVGTAIRCDWSTCGKFFWRKFSLHTAMPFGNTKTKSIVPWKIASGNTCVPRLSSRRFLFKEEFLLKKRRRKNIFFFNEK